MRSTCKTQLLWQTIKWTCRLNIVHESAVPCMPPSWTQSPKIAAHLQIFPRVPGSHSRAAGTEHHRTKPTRQQLTQPLKQPKNEPSLTGSNFPAQAARLQGGRPRAASPPRWDCLRGQGMQKCDKMQKELVYSPHIIAYLSVSASAVPMRAAFIPPTIVSKTQCNSLISAFPCSWISIYFLFRGIFSR